MRHQVDGRKFGRNTSHRVAMLRNMANAVITQEQVVTTVQKAKEVRRVVDRLITLGKKGSLHNRRVAFDRTRDKDVVGKLFGDLAKRFEKRPGGYTRVLKLADRRWGDAAEMAVLELVEHPEIKRGRQGKAPAIETASAEGADAAKAAPQVQDPFNRFRKMFKETKKASGGKAGGAAKAARAKSSAGRKTPAASGGGKSGGAS